MKTKITLENFGHKVRVNLVKNQGIEATNMFTNLAWLCGSEPHEDNFESFITLSDKLVKAIQAYRAVNTWQPRRGKGQWKCSPFEFSVIMQTSNKGSSYEVYSQGTYQDTPEEQETRLLVKVGLDKAHNELAQAVSQL